MIILSTTSGWNLGDDLIREGVYNVLEIDPKSSILWLNRNQISVKDKEEGYRWTPQWRLQRNYPQINDLIKYVNAFIVAGTPEWGNTLLKVYKLCIKFNIPIYIVGVGMYQADYIINIIKKANEKKLIKGATVRDIWAMKYLKSANIDAKWFFDPAFHANYKHEGKKEDVIFTPLLIDKFRDFYINLYEQIKEEISIISVHEPFEYIRAKQLFEEPIFYNSDYKAYKSLYSACKYYIGGRSHGCIPVMASGGFAHIFEHKKKQEMLLKWANEFSREGIIPNIKVHDPDEYNSLNIQDHEEYNFSEIKSHLILDLERHREYWKGKIDGI